MSAPKIEAVLFDLDGVLYGYDRKTRLELLESALGVPADAILTQVFKSDIEEAHDSGLTDVDAYISAISARLGVPVRLGQWLAARKWSMSPEMPMLMLARDLGAKVDIAMMTNNGHFLADNIDELAPELRGIFGDRMYFSGLLGAGKEKPEAFLRLADALGWRLDRTLFVDDNPAFIAAADRAGLVTHRFDGIEGFRIKLAEFGLL